MATLHVRNVPDELYEELRASAERDGRSIGAEAITLLRFALSERTGIFGRVRARCGSRFADARRSRAASPSSAQELVLRAQELCRRARLGRR